jgi:uncharacterized phage-associated protein
MKKIVDVLSPNRASDFLLIECRERGEILTNLKLQKLLYYAQAWFLALKDKPLFNEDFQAWVHGPALPSQYRRFKKFGWGPILLKKISSPKINERITTHLREVVDVFGVETASALELMTHDELPWKEVRKGMSPDQSSTAIISKKSMLSFYRKLKNENK